MSQTSVAQTLTTREHVAARAVELRKLYGEGQAVVAALDGITIEFAASSPRSWGRPAPESRR
jgi:hypothetical protein